MIDSRTLRLLVAAAVLLGGLDAGGRALAAARLDAESGSLTAGAAVAGLALAVLVTAAGVRPGSLRLVLPALLLAVIGDVIAFRLRLSAPATVPTGGGVTAAVAVAVFCVTVVTVRDVSRCAVLARPAGLIGLLLMLMPLVPHLGREIGGARIWIAAPGGGGLAPGEIGRVLLLLGVAGELSRLVPALAATTGPVRRALHPSSHLTPLLALPAAGVALMLVERDLGPAAIVLASVGLTLTIVTGRHRFGAIAAAALTLAVLLGALLPGRLHTRVLDVVDPFRHEGGGPVQAGLGRLGSAWGGWDGVGLGGGLAGRDGAIPAQASDYALAFWSEETGMLGLTLLIALLAVLLTEAWRVAARTRAGFDAYASVGACTLLTVQTVWVCGAALGWLPLTGVVTPLVSNGGSSRVAIALTLALLVCAHDPHGVPGRVAPRPDLRLDHRLEARLRLAALGAAAALLAIVLATSVRLASSATELSRRADNPMRAWSTLDRGPIVSSDGAVLAETFGAASLDRVHRRAHDRELAGLLVGHARPFASGTGLEQAWGAMLRCGGSGQAPLRDPLGRTGALLVEGNPSQCEPAGLRLTLSLRVQAAARRAIGARPGAVVVLDPRTGGIVAAYGRAHSRRGEGSWRGSPLDLALAPGSTFKLVTAASALTAGVPTANPPAEGFQPVGGPWLPNAGGSACGGELEQALAASCNSSFARIATRVGSRRLARTAAALGFGQAPAVSGLPAASSTVFGDGARDQTLLASSGIGQGRVVATPLQMAQVAAAVAADGVLAQPHLVAAACARGETVKALRPRHRRVLAPRVAERLRRAMRVAVTGGTARRLRDAPGAWAAKTGTAEVPRLAQTHTPAGTAAWIVGAPTRAGVGLAVAVLVLPTPGHPAPAGGVDAADVLRRLAPQLPRGGARSTC